MQTKLDIQQNNEYKQTELGLLPKEWEVVNINTVADFTRGISWRKGESNRIGKGIPVLGIPNIEQGKINFNNLHYLAKEIPENKKLKINDILFVGSSGSLKNVGRNSIIEKLPFDVITFASFTFKGYVKDEEKLDKRFFYYLINSPWTDFSVYGRRASDGKFNFQLTNFKNEFKIPLPPLPEQKAIAFVLSTIQTAKEKTEKVIQATKELKKSMMKHLFTYGPVSLEDAEKVKLKETEIGKMPEEWEIIPANKIFSCITDGTHDTPKKLSKGFPLIKSKQIKNGRIDRNSIDYFISQDDYILVNKRSKVNKGDILLSMIGTLGEAALITEEPDFTIKNIGLFKTNENLDLAKYCFYYFQTSEFKNYLISNASGTTQKYITLAKLRKLPIIKPDESSMKKIASILSAIDEKIQAEENKKKALEELFKSMLHNLMTAKIRVKDFKVAEAN